MPDDELLTPEESAAYLKMHVDSVRRLLRNRKLPGVKVGGSWRISKSILNAVLAGSTAQVDPARNEDTLSK
jgi:excisionase family DNA binding protein